MFSKPISDIQVFYTDGESASLFAIHGYSVGEYQLEFKLKAEGRARIMLTESPTGPTDRYNIGKKRVLEGGEI